MTDKNRRRFLKRSAAIAAVTATISPVGSADAAPKSDADSEGAARPAPHQAMPLVGLHAYAQKSLAAGETVEFRVSSTVPYRLDVCRLAGPVDEAASDIILGSVDADAPLQQPIYPGSYVHVQKALSEKNIQGPCTFECWCRPWRVDRQAGIITQFDDTTGGIGLFVGADGYLEFRLAGGEEKNAQRFSHTHRRLARRRWSHLVATFNGKDVVLYVDGVASETFRVDSPPSFSPVPLRLGAFGANGFATGFLDGDLAMPAIYSKALSGEEVSARYKQRGGQPPKTESLLALWPLDEEGGDAIHDASGEGRDGTLVNHGTWMIGGPGFRAEAIPRYSPPYDPANDQNRRHGLRLASDDLVDCSWKVCHRYPIKADAPSGVYVGRFRYDWDGKPMSYDCTFIVRRPENRPKAPILMLCSSSTWLAYNCAPFPRPRPAGLDWNAPSLPGAPSYCCYSNHSGEQPTYYLGLNRPWPGAGADNLFSPREVGYSHLMRGELFTHRWLDGVYDEDSEHPNRYAYDVVTDLDLHQDPNLLEGYKTVIVNGHSEYWSAEAFEGLDQYLAAGGTAIIMSGNTFFWRTSFSDDGSVMECRKYDARIGGRRSAEMGETWHSQDGHRGSLMRECGFPEYETFGLSCIGWDGQQRKEDYGIYYTRAADHFLFRQPEQVGLADGDTFGHAPDGGLPHAVGHEWDVRLGALKEVTSHIPAGAHLPDNEPEGIVTLAQGYRDAGGGTFDYFTNPARTRDGVSAELIYWERPAGGKMVHFGAIAIGWALSADPVLAKLVRNTLHHFGVPKKEDPLT